MITVRTAEKKIDFNFIVNAQIAMAYESEEMKLDREVVERGVCHVFDNEEVGRYYVACYEEKVVACLLTLYEWSDWRAGNVLWIHSVYTQTEWRRRGIYRKMYQFLQEEIKNDPEQSLKGIRLYVEKENIGAIKTYESLGMESHRYHLFEWMLDH